MTDIRSSCNAHSVTRFLNEQLEENEEQQLLSHLDECDACREQIELAAADDQWWQETSDFLTADEIDKEIQATKVGDSHSTEENSEEKSIHRGSIGGVIDQLSPTDDPHMMGRFGGYEIVGVVGCGGMGVVLKGHEAALNRYVAIKILAPHLATSGAARNRFSREGQSAASVVHPNVVSIHRVSEDKGLPFLVMPYVAGESLQKRIDNQGALSVSAIVRIGLQVCRGLAAAHAQGLVHRDVKPANILLEKDVDRIVLTDFGLARAADDASMTKSGVLAGTPQYMSPEQARGERLDQRSDLFSLGSVFYTLCTGRPPFRSETSYGILRKITDNSPRPIREINPDIPNWLVRLINKLHEKSPEKRFDTAAEIADLLEQCLAHLQQPDVQALPEELQSLKKFSAKRMLISGAVTVSVIAASIMFLPETPRLQTETETTQSKHSPESDESEKIESTLASESESTPPFSDSEWNELNNVFSDVQQLHEEVQVLDQTLDRESESFQLNLPNSNK